MTMTPGAQRDGDKDGARTILVKLGGSVLTRKSTLGGIRYDNIKRFAQELASVARHDRLVLVHGGGSFGHPLARLYHIYGRGRRAPASSDKRWRSEGASAIQRSMLKLNAAVVGALVDSGISALSVPGGVLVELYDGELEAFHPGSIERYLAAGLTPVTFGDVAPDRDRGLAIVSGDTLILALAETLRPDLVVFATDTDGIYDRDPNRHKDAVLLDRLDAGSLRRLAAGLSRDDHKGINPLDLPDHDATGGMLLKIHELVDIADLGVPAIVLNGLEPGRLKEALSGRPALGTRVKATVPGRFPVV